MRGGDGCVCARVIVTAGRGDRSRTVLGEGFRGTGRAVNAMWRVGASCESGIRTDVNEEFRGGGASELHDALEGGGLVDERAGDCTAGWVCPWYRVGALVCVNA